jgi:hypothetical protein
VIVKAVTNLAVTGYAGGDLYIDERFVVDSDLITAGPRCPVQLARATRARLGLVSPRTLEVYEALFDRGDRAALRVLMEGHPAG